MPKPINWDQFTMLTPEQREEMKTFVDHFGKTVEKHFKIELNEDYVRAQIEKNNKTYQKSLMFVKQVEHFKELDKQFPKPKECPNHEIFARGYRLYLTDNAEENKALQESLKTKDGRQALINRMVKDLMELDIAHESNLDSLDAAVEAANNDPRMQELKFLTSNLNVAIGKEFPLAEPLKTAFDDKCKLLESCDTNRAVTRLAATPMGLLLPMEKNEHDVKLVEQMIKKNPQAPKLFDYTNCINATALEDEVESRKPSFNQMKQKGWLNNDVRLKDRRGNYVNKGDALRGMAAGKKYTAEKLSPEAAGLLDRQMGNLDVYTQKSERDAAKAHLDGQLEQLKSSGLQVKAEDLTAVFKNKETKLVFYKEDIYPRKLEYDKNTKQFKVGEAIRESPAEPKKPNGFKRFLHGISSRLFKSDFDKYEKDMSEYRKLSAAYEEVRAETESRWTKGEEDKYYFREKQNEAFSKQIDAERSFERPMENIGVINDSSKEQETAAEKLAAANKKLMEQRSSIGNMPAGTLRDFSMMVNGYMVNMMAQAAVSNDLTGWRLDEVRTCMAHGCVLDLIQTEHTKLGDKAPGQLEQRLGEEMTKAGEDEILPIVNTMKNNPTFKRFTETMTADRVADFLLNNGAHKLNEAMAKTAGVQKNSGTDKAVQNDKTLDNNQPVLTDPNHQMHGPQNSLRK